MVGLRYTFGYAHCRDIDTLSARTHQPSFPRQTYLLIAPRHTWALSTTPKSVQLHTNSSRRLHFGSGVREARLSHCLASS
eukprot:COSAG02_NODE_463_length_21833_cov_11.529539_14_plen_80_part_00